MINLLLIFILESYAQSTPFTFNDLRDLIRINHLTRIEDVLANPGFPQAMRSNYTLVNASESLQSGTYDEPRVVMFGDDARLTCTFNSETSLTGSDTMECLQFDDAQRRFDYRQIQFPTPENGLTRAEFSESGQTVDKTKHCTQCHGGNDMRPIWDEYPLWTGVYGSDHDRLGSDDARYAEFAAKRSQDPRYKWLIQHDDRPIAPYAGNLEVVTDLSNRPNLRLADYLGAMMGLRDARILESRVSRLDSVAFAVRALQCKLPAGAQLDIDLDQIFANSGISLDQWRTQNIHHDLANGFPRYEFESGFTFLSLSVGMGIVQDLAIKGDAQLAAGLEKLRQAPATDYKRYKRQVKLAINSILPDPDVFKIENFERNIGWICPRLTEVYRQELTKNGWALPAAPPGSCRGMNLREMPEQTSCNTKTGRFQLVKRGKTGQETWRDLKTGLLWSDSHGNNTQSQIGATIACNVFNDTIQGKSIGIGGFHLPTREEFLEAEKNGIREILNDARARWFWSQTRYEPLPYLGYVFAGSLGYVIRGDVDEDLYSTICVSSL
jgi:hypothetical protein